MAWPINEATDPVATRRVNGFPSIWTLMRGRLSVEASRAGSTSSFLDEVLSSSFPNGGIDNLGIKHFFVYISNIIQQTL